MTSSWMSAHAWRSSSEVAAATAASGVGTAGAAPAPVAERRAQALAAAQQVGEGVREGGEIGADVVEDRHLDGEEVVEPLLDADPQVLGVQRRDRHPRGCHARQGRRGPLFRPSAGRLAHDGRVSASGPRRLGPRSSPYPRGMPDRARSSDDSSVTVAGLLAGGGRSFSFEFFPPRTDEGERAAVAGDPRARRPAALVRVGDLRRRRVHARPHGARDAAHRRGDDAAADGAPDLRGIERAPSCARSSARTPTPGCATCWPCAATRPADRARRGCSTRRDSRTPTSSSRWCARSVTSPSVSRPSPRGIRNRPRSTTTPACCSPSRRPAPSSRSRSCSSRRRTTSTSSSVRAPSACTMPIVPGLMPLTNISQIERFAVLSGTAFPDGLADRFRAVADDPVAVHALGVRGGLGARLRAARGRGTGPALLHAQPVHLDPRDLHRSRTRDVRLTHASAGCSAHACPGWGRIGAWVVL